MGLVRFKKFISEGGAPLWVRFSVGAIVLRLNNLRAQLEAEDDEKKRDIILGKMNALVGMISGLGIAVGGSDAVLLKKIKGIIGGKK